MVAQAQQRRTAQSSQQWLSYSMQDPSSEQHTAQTSAAQQVDPTHEAFWAPGSAPGTLSYALTQVELLAAPGSSWPPEQQAAFTKAADLVGGFWVLTQCGEWGEGHPLVGQPARVLTQLVLLTKCRRVSGSRGMMLTARSQCGVVGSKGTGRPTAGEVNVKPHVDRLWAC